MKSSGTCFHVNEHLISIKPPDTCSADRGAARNENLEINLLANVILSELRILESGMKVLIQSGAICAMCLSGGENIEKLFRAVTWYSSSPPGRGGGVAISMLGVGAIDKYFKLYEEFPDSCACRASSYQRAGNFSLLRHLAREDLCCLR